MEIIYMDMPEGWRKLFSPYSILGQAYIERILLKQNGHQSIHISVTQYKEFMRAGILLKEMAELLEYLSLEDLVEGKANPEIAQSTLKRFKGWK